MLRSVGTELKYMYSVKTCLSLRNGCDIVLQYRQMHNLGINFIVTRRLKDVILQSYGSLTY